VERWVKSVATIDGSSFTVGSITVRADIKLAEAGLLKGKKYAYAMEEKSPYFAGATFAGIGVVRDGLIIISGICPSMASVSKHLPGMLDAVASGSGRSTAANR
jgi:hypothetical protein